MHCPHCGEAIPVDARFCNYCGKNTEPSGQPTPTNVLRSGFLEQNREIQVPNDPYLSAPFAPTPFQTPPLPSYVQTTPAPFPQTQPFYPTPLTSTLPPALPPPPALNRIQRFMIRTFQPALAANAIFGVVCGSIFAAIVGVGATQLLLMLFYAFVDHSGSAQDNASRVEQLNHLLGLATFNTTFNVPLRDTLQWFLIIQNVGTHVQYGGTASSSFASPLYALLVIPAFLLVCGGYIAACTDMQNRLTASLLRGAAIALPYSALLLLIALQVNGAIPAPVGTSQGPGTTITMDTVSLLFYGLLWGAFFGTLGASLKLAQGRWRNMLHSAFALNRHPQMSGMVMGGLVATGIGVAASFLAIVSLLAYTPLSVPLVERTQCVGADWRVLTIQALKMGPLYAVNLFAFLFGAPITAVNQAQGADGECYYTSLPHATFSLFDAQLHLPFWFFALLLLPIVSLFLGGRASVAVARVQGIGPAAVQGALIALPFAVLMAILAAIATDSSVYTVVSSSSSSTSLSFMLSAGVRPFDLLLWALLSGAVLGGLGGMYQASAFKLRVSYELQVIGKPLLQLCAPLYALCDRLSGYPPTSARSTARNLLYAALLCALLLAVGIGLVGVLLITQNQLVTFEVSRRIQSILSVVCIALPGLFLLFSAISALATNPGAEQPHYQQQGFASPGQRR